MRNISQIINNLCLVSILFCLASEGYSEGYSEDYSEDGKITCREVISVRDQSRALVVIDPSIAKSSPQKPNLRGKTFLQIMRLPENTSFEDAKKAYRKFAQEFHPDNAKTKTQYMKFTQLFKKVDGAYRIYKKTQLDANYSNFIDGMKGLKEKRATERLWSDQLTDFEEWLQGKKVPQTININDYLAGESIEEIRRKALEKAIAFDRQLLNFSQQKIDAASEKDFEEIAEYIKAEIAGEKTPFVLYAWFSSTRSVQRPELLEMILGMNEIDEMGKILINLVLKNPWWLESPVGRRGVSKLLTELSIFYSGLFDRLGELSFANAGLWNLLSTHEDLRTVYHRSVFNYLQKVNKQQHANSAFLRSFLRWPDLEKFYPNVLTEIGMSEGAYEQVVLATIYNPSYRDSNWFWQYAGSGFGWPESETIQKELKSQNSEFAKSEKAEELIRYWFESSKPNRGSQLRANLSLLKILVSEPWKNRPVAMELLEVYAQGRLTEVIDVISDPLAYQYEQKVKIADVIQCLTIILPQMADHPLGPKFLSSLIRFRLGIKHREFRTDLKNVILSQFESGEQSERWRSNPKIRDAKKDLQALGVTGLPRG